MRDKEKRDTLTRWLDEAYNKGYQAGKKYASAISLIRVEEANGDLHYAFRFGDDNIKEIPPAILDSLREGE